MPVLIDKNIIIYTEGCKLHRVDGPAVKNDIYQGWSLHGVLHRDNGPAVMHLKTRKCEWWVHGQFLTSAEIQQDTFDSYVEK